MCTYKSLIKELIYILYHFFIYVNSRSILTRKIFLVIEYNIDSSVPRLITRNQNSVEETSERNYPNNRFVYRDQFTSRQWKGHLANSLVP